MYISKDRRDAFNEKLEKINSHIKPCFPRLRVENNPEDPSLYRLVGVNVGDWMSRPEIEGITDYFG